MSKGTDNGDSELQHTGTEDKMGASDHAKSLEGINKIDLWQRVERTCYLVKSTMLKALQE